MGNIVDDKFIFVKYYTNMWYVYLHDEEFPRRKFMGKVQNYQTYSKWRYLLGKCNISVFFVFEMKKVLFTLRNILNSQLLKHSLITLIT